MKHLVAIIATFLMPFATVSAQEEPEYRAEIGVGAGLMTYTGDFNSSLTKNMQPAYSLVGRYKFNPRMALAMTVTYGKLKGSSDNTDTWYPETSDNKIEFSNTVTDIGLRFEYNFWPYGTGREYRGARPFTPYIGIGLGATVAKTQEKSVFTGNFPVGAGVKYKISERLNLGLEWIMTFSLSDKLDGVEDPYGIKSAGMFKNTDCYSTLRLSVTYDIMAKCKTCNNDRY
ncbi:MAG: outer membrane beta-barrel protein [Prevotella sp.]|nr:outer membrane beta-barrel protein [Prevotella sp.]